MSQEQTAGSLSQKDVFRRDFILTGNLWRVIPFICLPLALYQSANHLFKVIDNLMASHIGAGSVSAVAYLTQISQMILALGGGLAVGGSIRIARFYGAGDYKRVKTTVNTLFALSFLTGMIICSMIPFSDHVLRLFGTPHELIETGRDYFRIILFEVVFIFFNNVYMAVERARGNSKRILTLNLFSIGIKIGLTAFFVYGLNCEVYMIGVAGLAANMCITAAGLFNLRKSGDIFGFSRSYVKLRSFELSPLIRLSFPVVVEKMSFSFGKVIMNALGTAYGAVTAGAMGISNNIGGLVTMPQSGFQDGCASIISQNCGAGNIKRALTSYKITLLYTMLMGGVLCTLTLFFSRKIANVFSPDDPDFAHLIHMLYSFEGFGTLALGFTSSVMALIYGFGYTKISLLINVCRLFVFRIPVVFLLQRYTSSGVLTMGYAMLISNILTGLFSLIAGFFIIRHIQATTSPQRFS